MSEQTHSCWMGFGDRMTLDAAPMSTEHQIARYSLFQLLRMHTIAPEASVAVADAFLEAVAPAWPDAAPLIGQAQQEADWWVEFASDSMAAAMLSACLKRLVNRPMVARNAKKRALVAVWNSLNEADRAAFRAFVDSADSPKE
jgi:hypothetical protein